MSTTTPSAAARCASAPSISPAACRSPLLSLGGGLKTNPLMWGTAYFYAYLGAIVGVVLYFGVPFLLRRVARLEEEREQRRLSERQEALVEEWGANVSSVKLDFSRSEEVR